MDSPQPAHLLIIPSLLSHLLTLEGIALESFAPIPAHPCSFSRYNLFHGLVQRRLPGLVPEVPEMGTSARGQGLLLQSWLHDEFLVSLWSPPGDDMGLPPPLSHP
jgi:hypothetical protein